jgi:hypothetical protein
VRSAFVKEIHEKCAEWGLKVPEYMEAEQPVEYTLS